MINVTQLGCKLQSSVFPELCQIGKIRREKIKIRRENRIMSEEKIFSRRLLKVVGKMVCRRSA